MSDGRKLPVYLVLDTSGSMSGEPIEAVRTGMRALTAELKSDPQALETAFLSVITFNSSAQQVAPLADLLSFKEPVIDAGGATALGEALRVLQQCIDREVTKSSADKKGDWKPLIFVMTDGQPTDSWEAEADKLKTKPLGNIIACAAGPAANDTVLKRLTEIVVKLNNLQPDTLKAFFKWVSSSIKQTSQSIAQAPAGQPTNLPPPPAQVTIVP